MTTLLAHSTYLTGRSVKALVRQPVFLVVTLILLTIFPAITLLLL